MPIAVKHTSSAHRRPAAPPAPQKRSLVHSENPHSRPTALGESRCRTRPAALVPRSQGRTQGCIRRGRKGGGGSRTQKFVYQKWPHQISQRYISFFLTMVTLVWGGGGGVGVLLRFVVGTSPTACGGSPTAVDGGRRLACNRQRLRSGRCYATARAHWSLAVPRAALGPAIGRERGGSRGPHVLL